MPISGAFVSRWLGVACGKHTMSNDKPSRLVSRRNVITTSTLGLLSTLGLSSSALAHDDGGDEESSDEDEDSDSEWSPAGDIDPDGLTDKDSEELVDAIPDDDRERIEEADLFAPLNVLEAQQNNDRPEPGENGLSTLERDGDEVEYTITVNEAEDLENITQSHIHHADPGESDNRLFSFVFNFAALEGDDGDPAEPPVSHSGILSETEIIDADPDVPIDDEEGDDDSDEDIGEYIEDLFDNPRQYQNNVHTVEFQSEAIRSQLKPADFDELDREELIYTVLATAGLEGL